MKSYLHKKSKEELHRTFAGVIYESDFSSYLSLTDAAKRIVTSDKFNRSCIKGRDKREKYGMAHQLF